MSSSLVGLVLIITVLFLYMICLLGKNKFLLKNQHATKQKTETLRHLIANSLEEGTAVHCDVSNPDESGAISGGTLAALRTVRAISAQLASADEPLFITNNQGALTFFNQDAIQNGMRQSGLENEFDPNASIYAGYSPLSHQSGVIALLAGEACAVHLNMGTFGPEIALQDLAFDSSEGIIAAGDNLAGQAVAYVTADESFIGEEVFEIPQAVKTNPGTDNGLLVMDLLRIGMIVAILAGSIFAILA